MEGFLPRNFLEARKNCGYWYSLELDSAKLTIGLLKTPKILYCPDCGTWGYRVALGYNLI
jgi:hypothetical protein